MRAIRAGPRPRNRRFYATPRPYASGIGAPPRIRPRSEGGDRIEPQLRHGLGYLARASEDAVLGFVHSAMEDRVPYLWITDRAPTDSPEGGEVLRLTTIPGRLRTLDPRRAQELRAAAAAFLDEHGAGLVIVDGVDSLVLHNGVERVMRALNDLHEEVATRGAILVVFVGPTRTNPRLIPLLERELEALPEPSRAGDLERWMAV